MLLLCHSAAAGLAHLHTEIKEGTGRHGKPAIAHRYFAHLIKTNGYSSLQIKLNFICLTLVDGTFEKKVNV